MCINNKYYFSASRPNTFQLIPKRQPLRCCRGTSNWLSATDACPASPSAAPLSFSTLHFPQHHLLEPRGGTNRNVPAGLRIGFQAGYTTFTASQDNESTRKILSSKIVMHKITRTTPPRPGSHCLDCQTTAPEKSQPPYNRYFFSAHASQMMITSALLRYQ